jgi:hypothetical protein
LANFDDTPDRVNGQGVDFDTAKVLISGARSWQLELTTQSALE